MSDKSPTRFTAAGVRDIASSSLFQCPTGYCNVCGGNESRCPKRALRAYADVLEKQEKRAQQPKKPRKKGTIAHG